MRRFPTVVFSWLFVLLTASLCAQEMTLEEFRVDFNKALEFADPKLMDKATKKGAVHALRYFEELQMAKLNGDATLDPKLDALRASWGRAFEASDTMEKLQRWVELNGTTGYQALEKGRTNVSKVWRAYEPIAKEGAKSEHLTIVEQLSTLARNAQSLGHAVEAAEIWLLASVVASRVPDKNVDDRRVALDALKEFVEARKSWNFTGDDGYLRNHEFVKSETLALEAAAKIDEKRKADGFDPNAKGIDALLVPNGKQETLPLKFESLAAFETELDYGPRGGPVPAFWSMASLGKDGTNVKLDWFRRTSLYVLRTGAAKFGVSLDPNDPKKTQEIDAGNKGKPTTFWLDADKKQPYSMFFWTGSEKEFVGDADHNMAPSDAVGNVYYRSAASWKTAFGTEAITVYDDNASGTPCDADPMEPSYKLRSLGDHDGEGTPVPIFDSMRIGKGPRVPYSEFVHFPTGWFHMKRGGGDDLVLRPLSAEYLKTGKVKLVWAGPKPTMPVQLVVQGSGDFRTACFDVAGGKEVEMPVGSYAVVFGRIMIGKGARVQMATLYRGAAKAFDVEAGKTLELKMGAPFTIQFTRRGDQNVSIDALKVFLAEASGCVMTEMHGMTLWPEVMAAKAEDGKGQKPVGKFVRFTDPELVNKAAAKHNNLGLLTACFPMPEGYRDGELVLQVKLPAEGMKLALVMKKHPIFGAISSAFQ